MSNQDTKLSSLTLSDRLKTILGSTDSKQYAKLLSKHTALLQEIDSVTQQYNPASLAEKLYIVLIKPPVYCSLSKKPLFNTFNKGYRPGCGNKSVCECARKNQKKKMQEWQASLTAEQKHEFQTKAVQTNLQKYGVENAMQNSEIQQHFKQRYKEKTGFDTPMHNPDVIEKIRLTNIEKYGVEFPLQLLEVQAKSALTSISRYGGLMTHAREASYKKYNGNNPFTNAEVKQKIAETNLLNHKKVHPAQFHLTNEQVAIIEDKDLLAKAVRNKTIEQAALDLSLSPSTVSRRVHQHGLLDILAPSTTSQHETKMKSLLDSLGVKYVQNDTTLLSSLRSNYVKNGKIVKSPPPQIDFYLVDYNVGIEVGSLYYHSEFGGAQGRGMMYHFNKWKTCKDNGVTLFQWFDNELFNKWDIIENKVRYVTNNLVDSKPIGARKCTIDRVNLAMEREFLEKYHIQGFTQDRNKDLVFGAFFNGSLVALISAKRQKNGLEIARFATMTDKNFPGLFSRLLKQVTTGYVGTIFSYSNNNHSSGNLYRAAGFTATKITPPRYDYTDYRNKFHQEGYTRHKIAKRFGVPIVDDKGQNISEWALMQGLGYDRIWDSGKIKWEKST